MNQRINIPEKIYDDEVVSFIADRYHTTPRKVIERFIKQDEPVFDADTEMFRLEENEMAILRDMISGGYGLPEKSTCKKNN